MRYKLGTNAHPIQIGTMKQVMNPQNGSTLFLKLQDIEYYSILDLLMVLYQQKAQDIG